MLSATAIGSPPAAVKLRNGVVSRGSLKVTRTPTGPTPSRPSSAWAPCGSYATDSARGGVASAVTEAICDGADSVPALFTAVTR